MTGFESTRQVKVTVFLLSPEFNHVLARDAFDYQYGLNRSVEGVNIDFLKVGDVLQCTVTVEMPRVLSAEVMS